MKADVQKRPTASIFERSENARGYALAAPALILAAGLLLLPLIMLLLSSFWTQSDNGFDRTPTLANYASLLGNNTYLWILARTLLISLSTTILVVVLAYPLAAFIAFRVSKHKALWMLLVTAPCWSSYLLRIFAWKVILGYNGVINSGLIWLGIIKQPLEILLYNPFAIVLTLVHAWAPFAILPIYISLEKIDRSLIEASRDLGDGPFATFRRVLLPLSMPGIIAASLIVFVPTVGEYITPQLVGGPSGVMIGNVVQAMFGRENNWPLGAAISMVTMATVTIFSCAFLWVSGPLRRNGS